MTVSYTHLDVYKRQVLVGYGVVYFVAVRELHLHAGEGEAVVAREPDGHQPRVAGSVQICSLLSFVS